MTHASPTSGLSVRDLRRRWKPIKERARSDPRAEPLRIRIHRCCSWLQRTEELGEEPADDTVMLFRWIALNSLHGQWNAAAGEPAPDRESMCRFLRHVLEIDGDGRIAAVLEEHRRLVMAIYDDEYLTPFFWEQPGDERARKSKKTKYEARTWYREHQYGPILLRLMERIYFQRCQIVHGAATFGSRLNRTALRRCATMLGHLITAFLLAMIDHGTEEDWGPLCYPPLRTMTSTGAGGDPA